MGFANSFLSRVLNKLSSYPSWFSLPMQYWGYSLATADGQEIEIIKAAEVVNYCPQKRTAIDIGANIGYFTYPLSKLFACVHSFEINDHTSRPIAAYKSHKVNLHNVGLSDTTTTLSLFTPIKNGQELNGWASVEKRDFDWIDSYKEKKCKVMPLDEFDLHDVDFIKIDVEGHELQVISGGMELLKREKPLLLIETEGEKYKQLTSLLESIGYREIALSQYTDYEGSPQNHIYFHKDKLANVPLKKTVK